MKIPETGITWTRKTEIRIRVSEIEANFPMEQVIGFVFFGKKIENFFFEFLKNRLYRQAG